MIEHNLFSEGKIKKNYLEIESGGTECWRLALDLLSKPIFNSAETTQVPLYNNVY